MKKLTEEEEKFLDDLYDFFDTPEIHEFLDNADYRTEDEKNEDHGGDSQTGVVDG